MLLFLNSLYGHERSAFARLRVTDLGRLILSSFGPGCFGEKR